jgi:HAD superfamily hydrolase (TIGR01459 family)
MPNQSMPEAISGLSSIAPTYRALLCDVWGVVHNSFVRFEPACAALVAFRAAGGKVMLITNAPRPAQEVLNQLDALEVPREAYDDVITSGDVTRQALIDCGKRRVLNIGPARDLPLYVGLPVEFAEEADAEVVSCTGLFDDLTETPADYEERMQRWARRGLAMICANPDIVVERGERLVYCAGALARRYAEIGGKTVLAGKPYAPIYVNAIARLAALCGGDLPRGRILAIGDGVGTDIRGAHGQGLDALFITAGIHAAEWGGNPKPSAETVADFLGRHHLSVRAFMPRLSW